MRSPFLHISDAVPATSVDWDVVAVAALMAVSALILIWRPAVPLPRFAPTRRGTLARRFGGILMALALVPAVLPFDHLWGPDGALSPGELASHASHCHVSPATCSDSPATGAALQALTNDALIVEPGFLPTELFTDPQLVHGRTISPLTPPPRQIPII
jgi:hypothetical protein